MVSKYQNCDFNRTKYPTVPHKYAVVLCEIKYMIFYPLPSLPYSILTQALHMDKKAKNKRNTTKTHRQKKRINEQERTKRIKETNKGSEMCEKCKRNIGPSEFF